MKNTQRGFIIPFLLGVIAVLLIGGGLYFYNDKTAGVETYSDSSISFQYSSALSARQDKGSVAINHSIPYEHPDACDFKGNAPALHELTDFNVSIKVVNRGIKEYIQAAGWPDWSYVSANPYSFGSLKGYHIAPGVEGCGEDIYYFAVSPNKTSIITRPFVAEFAEVNADHEKYFDLPGVISKDKANEYFFAILSSLVVK